MIMTARDDLIKRLAALEDLPGDTPKRPRRFYIASDDPRTSEEIQADIHKELQPGERAIIHLG